MEHLPNDQNLNVVSDAAHEEEVNVERLTRSDIEQQIKDAEAIQRIESHLLLVDKYLSSSHFDKAGKSIGLARQSLAALSDSFEQKSLFDQAISSREQRLAELSAKLVVNADIDAIIAHLNRSDLRDIGEKIEVKLKDLEKQELYVTSQNKELSDKLKASEKTLGRKLNGLTLLFILLVVLLLGLFFGASF